MRENPSKGERDSSDLPGAGAVPVGRGHDLAVFAAVLWRCGAIQTVGASQISISVDVCAHVGA